MRALSISATGMSAQQTNLDVIANNIANSNTTAFKRSQAEFSDLIYQAERTAGAPAQGASSSTAIPENSQVGLGVQLSAIVNLNTQGPLNQTGNTLDLAIKGNGWFQVQGANNQTLYTRNGSLSQNAQRQLVTQDGSLIIPEITFPTGTINIQINNTGMVYADTGQGMQPVEQLTNCGIPQ